MNAYEIEQVEKHLRVDTRLPLSYVAWADIERRARAPEELTASLQALPAGLKTEP